MLRHCSKVLSHLQKIYSAAVIKYPTTPKCVATLPCEMFLAEN